MPLPPIVLASASPRRRELLEALGLAITIRPTGVPEDLLPGEDAFDAAERLARSKAEAAVTETAADSLVIAADTLVVLEGHALGKPADHSEAILMLRRLSGRRHEVVTGVAISHGSRMVSAREISEVYFEPMTEHEIESYASTPEPHDKAGAYGMQNLAGVFIERVDGSPSNVIGLPVRLVRRLLVELGFDLPFLTRTN
jgi:septum formation protein